MEARVRLQAPDVLPPVASHWVGWVGTRADLDVVTKRITLTPARNQILAVQNVASPLLTESMYSMLFNDVITKNSVTNSYGMNLLFRSQ
jgi:hypothetical protein